MQAGIHSAQKLLDYIEFVWVDTGTLASAKYSDKFQVPKDP